MACSFGKKPVLYGKVEVGAVKPEQKIIYVRMDSALHAAVKRLAHQRYCSVNELVSAILEGEVERSQLSIRRKQR